MRIPKLVDEFLLYKERVERAEYELDIKKEALYDKEQELVEACLDEGLHEISTKTHKIKVLNDINVRINKDSPEHINVYSLDGFEDIASRTIIVSKSVPVEYLEQAQQVLNASGIEHSIEYSIHPQTLKKFVKEHLAAGGEIPEAVQVSEYTKIHCKKL